MWIKRGIRNSNMYGPFLYNLEIRPLLCLICSRSEFNFNFNVLHALPKSLWLKENVKLYDSITVEGTVKRLALYTIIHHKKLRPKSNLNIDYRPFTLHVAFDTSLWHIIILFETLIYKSNGGGVFAVISLVIFLSGNVCWASQRTWHGISK